MQTGNGHGRGTLRRVNGGRLHKGMIVRRPRHGPDKLDRWCRGALSAHDGLDFARQAATGCVRALTNGRYVAEG